MAVPPHAQRPATEGWEEAYRPSGLVLGIVGAITGALAVAAGVAIGRELDAGRSPEWALWWAAGAFGSAALACAAMWAWTRPATLRWDGRGIEVRPNRPFPPPRTVRWEAVTGFTVRPLAPTGHGVWIESADARPMMILLNRLNAGAGRDLLARLGAAVDST
ncbi:hypothetical protein [Alienimonas californiensis]|uniref:PH domain-containing protein n=1 Tax=Alienimonas californiensis TaxID=2527989 RepID=A0A517P632_9PLAN|nr:hypothetical protein [Alienimonas californiensis]QDT14806.1 hypothetical protein CA12_08850 [Alienimonas californiensis]